MSARAEYATAEETASVLRKATPDETWLAAQIERIDPHEAEQGNDGAYTRAVVKLALEMRDQRDELLSVLIAVRDRFFPADQPERDRDAMWQPVNDAIAKHKPSTPAGTGPANAS